MPAAADTGLLTRARCDGRREQRGHDRYSATSDRWIDSLRRARREIDQILIAQP